MRLRTVTRLLVLFSLLIGGPVLALGRDGHQIVGLLAERDLTPEARAAVAELLAGEPDPTLAGVSTWADELRDNGRNRNTARWHWINFPKEGDCTYQAERDCADGQCIVAALRQQLVLLSDRQQPLATRREALKFVVHLVADVHQPFHAGFAEDRGGNSTQVRWLQQGWNLHGIWDSAIVQHAGLAPDAYAAKLAAEAPLPPDRSLFAPDPVAAWAEESCRAIRNNALYPERRRITGSYLEQFRPLSELRMRQAGSRLAALLNATLAASP